MTAAAHIVTAALLLAHPAPLDAQSGQASDGPVLKNTTNSVDRQPRKGGFFMPVAFNGQDGPTRKDGRASVCAFLTSCPPGALKNAAGGYLSQTGA